MRAVLSFSVLLFPIAIAAAPACAASSTGGSNGSGTDCTLLACGKQGINVDFSYRDAGSYAVEVTIDGVKNTCTATLPLPRGAAKDDACAAAGIYLTRVGSELSADQQSIGGLVISSLTAKSVVIRVTRDGAMLREASFEPNYSVTPGPNGPDCEPKQCKSATFALP